MPCRPGWRGPAAHGDGRAPGRSHLEWPREVDQSPRIAPKRVCEFCGGSDHNERLRGPGTRPIAPDQAAPALGARRARTKASKPHEASDASPGRSEAARRRCSQATRVVRLSVKVLEALVRLLVRLLR